jgi:hypothetical protein
MNIKEILDLVEKPDFEKRKRIVRELDEYKFETKIDYNSLMKELLKRSKRNLDWHQKDFIISIIRRVDLLCSPYIMGEHIDAYRRKSNIEIKCEKRKYNYGGVLDALGFSKKCLLDDDGRVRVSAVHTIGSLRDCLKNEDYIELFFSLLFMFENEDKKIAKNIGNALEKIWCPHLEDLLMDATNTNS